LFIETIGIKGNIFRMKKDYQIFLEIIHLWIYVPGMVQMS
jgi:hypothetical protein